MHNQVLVQAIARARADELRRTGAASAASPRSRGRKRQHHVTEALRRRTGWLLVAVGLRLALSGSAAAPAPRRSRPA
jgi:hypothetical protein